MFSLLAQQYGITWAERYKCYILPDTVVFDRDMLKDCFDKIDSIIQQLKNNVPIDKDIIEGELKQNYYTKTSLVRYLTTYINSTVSEKSILLDPAAGIGNLIDDIQIPKENIYLIEPDEESASILRNKGYINVINSTFEKYLDRENFPKFTHVIMNPPFKKRADLFFFNACFKLLQENGRIAFIIYENSIYEELQSLGYTFNIDFASSEMVNNFEGLTPMMQEFFDNLHNTRNCFVDITTSFYNTSARAYYLLAEKSSDSKRKKGYNIYIRIF